LEDEGMKIENSTRPDVESRRKFLEKAGKLAVYTPPAVVALMQPGMQAIAASHVGVTQRGNNGLGQRVDDPQPAGLEDKEWLWNDRPDSIPGEPNNRGGPND
jgi:hypothetical protein